MCKTIILAYIFCLLITTKANAPTDLIAQYITTTTRIDNYILQNQRQYIANIKTMAVALEEFKKNFDNRLDILSLNREFLQFKLIEAERRLVPLELLDDVHNYCVHKYRPKLPEISSINISLSRCTDRGREEYQSIVDEPFSTLNKLESYYRNETVVALLQCKKTYEEAHENYTTCVTDVIQQSNEISSVNINMFYNQLKNSELTAILKMKNVFDCHAFVIFRTLTSLGKVTGLVDNCTAGNEFRSSCGEGEA